VRAQRASKDDGSVLAAILRGAQQRAPQDDGVIVSKIKAAGMAADGH
jgi:hypothetical protein